LTDLFDRIAAQALSLGMTVRSRARSRFEPTSDWPGQELPKPADADSLEAESSPSFPRSAVSRQAEPIPAIASSTEDMDKRDGPPQPVRTVAAKGGAGVVRKSADGPEGGAIVRPPRHPDRVPPGVTGPAVPRAHHVLNPDPALAPERPDDRPAVHRRTPHRPSGAPVMRQGAPILSADHPAAPASTPLKAFESAMPADSPVIDFEPTQQPAPAAGDTTPHSPRLVAPMSPVLPPDTTRHPGINAAGSPSSILVEQAPLDVPASAPWTPDRAAVGQSAPSRPDNRSRSQPDSGRPAPPAPTPPIEITIGRLEIRAEAPPPPRPARPFQPHLDLAAYRAKREGRE
jgi:hypothetical protein